MGFPIGTIVKAKTDVIPYQWLYIRSLPDSYFQVLESDECPFVWVINGGGVRCIQAVYLTPEPFLQAIYYRRWRWWKRLRSKAYRYIGVFYWTHRSAG